MAALPTESPSAIDRPRAGWVTALVPAYVAALYAMPAVRLDELPVPDLCRPFLRDGEAGEDQYREAVREALVRVPQLGRELAELSERQGVRSDAFARAVLIVSQRARCPQCGRTYLVALGAEYCDDKCRRRAAARGQAPGRRQPRRMLRDDCAHCRGPLREPETLFCSSACFVAAQRRHMGMGEDERRTACAHCGDRLTRGQCMFCSRACQYEHQREWFDGLVTR